MREGSEIQTPPISPAVKSVMAGELAGRERNEEETLTLTRSMMLLNPIPFFSAANGSLRVTNWTADLF